MYYYLIFLSSVCASFGQICLKLGSSDKIHLYDFLNATNLLGCMLYFIGLMLWIFSLSKLPLSVVYAFTLLTFLMVFVFSHFLLDEPISKIAVLGLGFIFVGFLCLFFGQIGIKVA